jgi:hypothetical protein
MYIDKASGGESAADFHISMLRGDSANATQVFEAVAIVGAHAHVGVHVETGDLRASLAHDRSLGILADASQTRYAAASARPRRDQAISPSTISAMPLLRTSKCRMSAHTALAGIAYSAQLPAP